MDAVSGLVAGIHLGAWRRNLARLADDVRPVPIMAMVKADAYGHGMLPLALAAERSGVGWLGALEIPAGLALRDAGSAARVFVWLHGGDADFAAAAEAGLDVGVTAEWQLAAIADAAPRTPLRVHLKVDSGLHRAGVPIERWRAFAAAAARLERSGAIEVVAVWSHLADAGEAADRAALAVLREAVATAREEGLGPRLVHLGASSAGLYLPEARFDLVRFGIVAYGISPFDDRDGSALGVEPVMTLRSVVVDTRDDMAVVAGGWLDGIQQVAAGRAEVLLAGRRARVTAVEADRLIVDAGAPVGAEAVLFGAEGAPSAEAWARWCDTIGDEIVTGVAARVPRVIDLD